MLARTVSIIILGLTVSLAQAQSINISKTGKIKLKINTEELHTETIKLATSNKKISGDLRLYHSHIYDDFSYKDVIKGEFVLNNNGDHDENIQYQLVFKDKKGLVAKTVGHISLAQGKNQAIACSNIPLSVNEIKNISLYEIKLIASK